MSKQITVRLPDELVDFIDLLVADGAFEGRAAIVTRELRRMKQRLAAERDAEIYRRDGDDPELVAIARYQAAHPLTQDD